LSFDRASEQRIVHRRAHRQLLALAGVGVVACFALAAAGRPALALAGASWLAMLALMVDWHLGMLEGPHGEQIRGLGAANIVTLSRGAAIPVVFVLGARGLIVALACLGALDVLDGALARRCQQRSRLGAWLDGSIDVTAAAAIGIAAFRLDVIPVVVFSLVVLRVALPWLQLTHRYFLSARPVEFATDVREPGWVARVPGFVATLGLVLALAGARVGALVMALGLAASIVSILPVVKHPLRILGKPPRGGSAVDRSGHSS
jgi:phosphatidylglycerophosphate synthase